MFLALITFCLATGLVVAGPPIVKLGEPSIIGRSIPTFRQDFFGGIPYAEPPVGSLRLKPPVLKISPGSNAFNASSFGNACLQTPRSNSIVSFSEDCLKLNILRPAGIKSTAKLPVLFWTYGGSFRGGDSSLFNGTGLVARSVERGTPVIYVDYNYRLGPLGYPQGAEAKAKEALNLGMRDQLAALEWLQENIGSFGGDKKKVTIFGESAGSVMSSALFLNSGLEKYARAAIFQSGFPATQPVYEPTRAEPQWQDFVSKIPSCASVANTNNTFDCLQQAPTSEIWASLTQAISSWQISFSPTIDGHGGLIPDSPAKLLAQGSFSKLPFIAGTNLDEGTGFIGTESNFTDQDIALLFYSSYYPPRIDQPSLQSVVERLLQLYPDIPALGSPFNTGNETFGFPQGFKRAAALLGDISFQSTRRYLSQVAARAGVPSYGYLYTQPIPRGDPPLYGVRHAIEIPYVFGLPPDNRESDLRVSVAMMDYWLSFASTLTPNDGRGSSRPVWPIYKTSDEILLELNGNDIKQIPDTYRNEQIGYLNSIPDVLYHRSLSSIDDL